MTLKAGSCYCYQVDFIFKHYLFYYFDRLKTTNVEVGDVLHKGSFWFASRDEPSEISSCLLLEKNLFHLLPLSLH